jgi:anti-sigma factor RsiW
MICPKELGKEGAEILVDYCAQTLDPARAVEFERHMEICGDCRRLVQAQSDVWETLDQWTPEPVSADFDARVYARIAQEQAAPAWRQWWWRISRPVSPFAAWKPAVSLAAACAVLAVAFVVHLPGTGGGASQIAPEKVDIEQVEKTLDDLDILTPVPQSPAI